MPIPNPSGHLAAVETSVSFLKSVIAGEVGSADVNDRIGAVRALRDLLEVESKESGDPKPETTKGHEADRATERSPLVLSLERLAEQVEALDLGVEQNWITEIERDRIRESLLAQIVSLLETRAWWISAEDAGMQLEPLLARAVSGPRRGFSDPSSVPEPRREADGPRGRGGQTEEADRSGLPRSSSTPAPPLAHSADTRLSQTGLLSHGTSEAQGPTPSPPRFSRRKGPFQAYVLSPMCCVGVAALVLTAHCALRQRRHSFHFGQQTPKYPHKSAGDQ